MASTKKSKRKNTKSATQTKRTTKDNNTKNQGFIRNEILILVSLAICIFLQISLFGIGGFIGDALSGFLFGTFGFLAYIVPIMSFIGIAFISQNKGIPTHT